MALTRILRGASSSANPLVSVSMAPFVEAYSRAPAVGPEPLDCLLHGESCPEDVDVVVKVKALFGDLREGAEAEYSGVVDQNVQSSERSIHFFE
jgi:hypothetical protein